MLISKPTILQYLNNGLITISPFKPENLGSAQYDVSLGEYCYRETGRAGQIYNPYSQKHVEKKWTLDRAIPHYELIRDFEYAELDGVGLEEKIILLKPNETILGHTIEFIGGSCEYVTTMMKARSSVGRNFIEVCKCAGMGDVGYFNRWTMEITNNSQYHTLPLVVGRRIAQILFFQVDPVSKDDVYDKGGKYQTSSRLEELQASWVPESMLPKQWKDRETQAVNRQERLKIL